MPHTAGYYYLHVLTVDKAGNKKETVSQRVTVTEPEPDEPEEPEVLLQFWRGSVERELHSGVSNNK